MLKVCAQGHNFALYFHESQATVTFHNITGINTYYPIQKSCELCVDTFHSVSFLYNKDLKPILIRIWQR